MFGFFFPKSGFSHVTCLFPQTRFSRRLGFLPIFKGSVKIQKTDVTKGRSPLSVVHCTCSLWATASTKGPISIRTAISNHHDADGMVITQSHCVRDDGSSVVYLNYLICYLWKAGLICSKFGPADSFAEICYLVFQNSICKFTICYYDISHALRHPIKIMTVTDGSPR